MNTVIILSIFETFIVAAPFIFIGVLLFGAIEKNGCAHVSAWIIGFIGLVVFAIVLDSTVAFFIAVGIFAVIYGLYRYNAKKYEEAKKAKEDSNHGNVDLAETNPTIYNETVNADDIDTDEEKPDADDNISDADDHYCPHCGDLLLDFGNKTFHCFICDQDFRESELVILSKCCCPICGGDDLYAFEDFDCENKFVCRDCHQKFEVDEIHHQLF